MFGRREIVLFLRDRLALGLLALFLLSILVVVAVTLLNIHISDVQIPARYSWYGFTGIYLDRWYALLSFGMFGILIFLINGFLAVKLHGKRRGLALGVLAISILIAVLTLLVASAIFRLANASL